MPRFSGRRMSALRPVQSLKHIVDVTTTVIGVVVNNIPLIEAHDDPGLANTTRVQQGSTVHAIYLDVQLYSIAAYTGIPRVYMTVQKNPGNNITNINPSSTGDADEKKFVIHQEMRMVGEITGTTIPPPQVMFKGVIVIPRGYKRQGYNDRLYLNLAHGAAEVTGQTQVCIQCIYKEFR